MKLFWICLGGAAGTAARYVLGGWLLDLLGPAFPWGTLAVNLLGSLLLGFVMEASLVTGAISPTLRLALATGVLGGFTTYSSFNYDTLRLIEDGSWPLAGVNLVATLVGCLLVGFAGVGVARLLFLR